MATMFFLSGDVPGAIGNSHFVHVPYGTFRAADGWLIIAVITDEFWVSLVHALGLPELDTKERKRQPGRLADDARRSRRRWRRAWRRRRRPTGSRCCAAPACLARRSTIWRRRSAIRTRCRGRWWWRCRCPTA